MNSFSGNARGAAFMMLSMAGFVLNDAFMKLVLDDLGLFQAIAVRGIFACVLMASVCWFFGAFKGGIQSIIALKHPTVLLRALGELGGTFFFLTALSNMPIANVTAVLQILPLTITLGAAWFFGESVGWRRYGAICMGLLGVLLIIQPGTDAFSPFAIYALIATIFITMRDLVTRKMPDHLPSLLVSLSTAVVITIMGGIGSLFQTWEPIQATQVSILIAAAAILMVGYVFSILAMRFGEVSFVSPFRYSILIWALALGYFLFGEVPNNLAFVGAVVVVASGLFTFYRERIVKADK